MCVLGLVVAGAALSKVISIGQSLSLVEGKLEALGAQNERLLLTIEELSRATSVASTERAAVPPETTEAAVLS